MASQTADDVRDVGGAVRAPVVGRWRRPLIVLGQIAAAVIATVASGCIVIMATTSGALAAVVCLSTGLACVLARRSRWTPALSVGLVVVLVVWFAARAPGHNRDWTPGVSRLPGVTVTDGVVLISDVRAFTSRADGSFDRAWEDRRYRLDRLRGVDLMVQPFATTDAVAHTMLSFDFGVDGRLLLSIEARKEIGERYSPVAGALRQYELIYLFIDERDALTGRAFAGARLYGYPARVREPEQLALFFSSLCDAARDLRDRPAFYHIISDNCTTVWLKHLAGLQPASRAFDPIIVLNGRVGRMFLEAGAIDTELGYEDAKVAFRLDERVLEHAEAPTRDFSRLIRGLEPLHEPGSAGG